MNKYIIEEYVLNEFNASSKAREDVSKFVLANGFKSFFRNDKKQIRHNKTAKIFLAFKLFMKILILNKNDLLFIQTSEKLLKPILTIKKIRHFQVVYLIHDLFSLAYNQSGSIKIHKKEINKDIQQMSQCDYVIAHNPIMIKRLRQFGCKSKLISLGIFDYAINTNLKKRAWKEHDCWQIVFAGSLSKSPFLYTIDKTKHKYEMIVYGKPQSSFQSNKYKGAIAPEELPGVIEGHFGLIWEGHYAISTVDNYTLINNPHKLSMYIVAGLPVIAWKESAAGHFIKQHKIGFTIASLDELDNCLSEITSEQYEQMYNQCIKLRKFLCEGRYIKDALSQIK